jgi:FkbM family methyltransferase
VSTGEPLPDLAVVSLPDDRFRRSSLTMHTEQATDQIATTIWARGWEYWERPLPAFFAATIEPSSVVLDVGANTGYYSLLAASVAESVCVHAFEPLPSVAELLQRNLEVNEQGSQVTLVAAAVDDTEGQTELYVPTAGHGLVETSASLEASFRSSWSSAVTVRRETVDGHCRELPRVDVIKVDAECRELQVLRGASATLARLRPVVFLEVMDCEDWHSDVRALDELRQEVDYLSVRMRPDGALIAATVGYDEPWRNQALWPAERIGTLRDVCKRLRLPLSTE